MSDSKSLEKFECQNYFEIKNVQVGQKFKKCFEDDNGATVKSVTKKKSKGNHPLASFGFVCDVQKGNERGTICTNLDAFPPAGLGRSSSVSCFCKKCPLRIHCYLTKKTSHCNSRAHFLLKCANK